MRLYYSFGSSSFAPHILLRELEFQFQLECVDLPGQKYGKILSGEFLNVNPKGKVPALMLFNGQVLTECAVILEFISDLKPEREFFPVEPFARYRAREWMNFIATDLHKNVVLLLNRLAAEN